MSGKKLAQLIVDLDSDEFQDAHVGKRNWQALGRVAEGSLKETLAAKPSLEVRMRVTRLLEKLKGQEEIPKDGGCSA